MTGRKQYVDRTKQLMYYLETENKIYTAINEKKI